MDGDLGIEVAADLTGGADANDQTWGVGYEDQLYLHPANAPGSSIMSFQFIG